jgi:hypothetical protein
MYVGDVQMPKVSQKAGAGQRNEWEAESKAVRKLDAMQLRIGQGRRAERRVNEESHVDASVREARSGLTSAKIPT